MSKVQNNPTPLEQDEVVEFVKNKVAHEVTQHVFEQVIKLDSIEDICTDFANQVARRLHEKTFMTDQLDLTEKQKEVMHGFMQAVGKEARDKYISNMKKDTRTKNAVAIVETDLIKLIEECLGQIGQEINRGAVISCVAVSADTKNKDFNKIELNSLKHAGDITIPTRGVLIATNCIDIMKGSIEVDLTEEKKEEQTESE